MAKPFRIQGALDRRAFIGSGMALAAYGLSPSSRLFADGQADAFARKRMIQGAKDAGTSLITMVKRYNEYKDMNKTSMQKLMSDFGGGVSNLSKIGKCCGFLGAGLGVGMGVAQMFGAFGPTAEEKTALALKEISGKIDKLESTMLEKFDQVQSSIAKLNTTVEKESAKTQIRAFLNSLSALQKRVELYVSTLRANQPNFNELDEAEHSLTMGMGPDRIHEAVNGVFEQVLGENLATSLIEAEYKSTFGDMSRLADITMILTKLVTSAQSNYVLVRCMQKRRGDEGYLANNVKTAEGRVKYTNLVNIQENEAVVSSAQNLFGPMIQRISDKLQEYAQKAYRERVTNVKNYLEDRFAGIANTTRDIKGNWEREGPMSKTGFKKTRAEPLTRCDFEPRWGGLAAELKKKYVCDWLVTAYHPINLHSYKGFDMVPNRGIFNWHGSNYLWFCETDPDFGPQVGSNMMFVLLKWTDITTDYPEPQASLRVLEKPLEEWAKGAAVPKGMMPGIPYGERTFIDWKSSANTFEAGNKLYARETEVLHSKLPKETVTIAGNTHEESGVVLDFTILKPFNASAGIPGEFNFLKLRDGTWKGDDVWSKLVAPDDGWGLYGALFMQTTSPARMTIQDSGPGKLIFLYR